MHKNKVPFPLHQLILVSHYLRQFPDNVPICNPVPDKIKQLRRLGLLPSLDGHSTLKRSRDFRTQYVDVVSRKDDPETAAMLSVTVI